MMRDRPPSGWRAASLAAALFAITLNFLQPLAHAALARTAGPEAAARMWSAFCQSGVGEDDDTGSAPAGTKVHECCLGLAHAPALAGISTTFVLTEPTAVTIRALAGPDPTFLGGIRDGPSQPRGPPNFV